MGNPNVINGIPPLTILDDLEDAVCCFTPDGVITYANTSACTTLDTQSVDIIGKHLSELADHQASCLLLQAIGDISLEQPLLEYEKQNIQPDSGRAPRWYRWKIRGIYNRQHQLEELYAIGRETQLAAFRQLTDITPACIFILQDNRCCYVNDFFIDTIGYQAHELMNMNALDLIHPDYSALVGEAMERLIRGYRGTLRLDVRVLPRDGSLRWLDLSASRFEWEGKPAVLGAAYNITQRTQLQSALMQSESNFRNLADTAPTLIFVLGPQGLVYINQAFADSTGYTEEECLQMEPWEFFHPQHWDMIKEMTQSRVRGASLSGRYQTRMLPRDGREAWTDFALSPFTFNGSPATLGVAIDITEQKYAQHQVEYLTYHDKLTGLFNRAYLDQQMEEMDLAAHAPVSMIIVDVNGLKTVNDAFGHHCGDRMLKKVADIISSTARDCDLIGRWGGDDFIVLLPRTTEETARKIGQHIFRACGQISDFPVPVSISLGLASSSTSDQDVQNLFKQAEDGMYRNKMLENRSIRSAFVNSLEQTLWVRSHETQEHTARLRHLVLKIGNRLNLSQDEINSMTLLAALHDIGKIAIPNSILDKPGPLTPEEWELIKKHPEIGYRIALSNPTLLPIAEAILQHHERWDGKGYPLGAKGQDIPLLSRILALADAYDVMTTGRPYQAGITTDMALAEITACAGTQFDPHLSRIFIEVMSPRVTRSKAPVGKGKKRASKAKRPLV